MSTQRATLIYGTANDANPGNFRGTVGMMISICGLATFGLLSAVGFFVSLSAMRKSHRAGYTNGFAKWGMIAGCPPVIFWGGLFISILAGFIDYMLP
jgi:hypothetical protein